MVPSHLLKMYRYFQALSLDIVLGACAGMLFFDRLLEVGLNPIVYILLGLAVWCIYTFDHLLDARQIDSHASTFRHAFHQQHFKILACCLLLMGCTGLGLAVSFLKIRSIVFFGMGLGVLILSVFVVLKIKPQTWAFVKEISIATLYVGGIMLAPVFNHFPEKLPSYFWLLGIGYISVAWFNTIFLGILDKETDRKDGLSSLVSVLGENASRKILYFLLVLMVSYFILLYGFLNSITHFHLTLLFIIALIHVTAFLKGETDQDYTRRKLDASFMLPFLLLLV